MKSFTLLLLLPLCSLAQQRFSFQRTSHSAEISFVQLDSAKGLRSTVVEYPKYLVVIELPLIDAGANKADHLTEDIPKAQEYLRYLQAEYKKPVKYVLSTHWHLHSLSGITPFFEHGAQLVVAQSNWEYSLQHGLLNAEQASKYRSQVINISRDTLLLARSANPIQVWWLNEQYTFKPTKDYLFFYFPKSKSLYASCMCAMNHVDFAQRPKFVYSDRVSDLDSAIRVRQAPVDNFIKLTAEFNADSRAYREPVLSRTYFSEFIKRGTPMHVAVKKYTAVPLSRLEHHRDSVLIELFEQQVSPGLINAAVYECLKEKDWQKAVAWAQVLNLYMPGDPDYIDTLGETYFLAGNIKLAEYYSKLLKRLDAENFPDAMKTWAHNKGTAN
jgi:hypothetical protein